jgi:predicted dehydrogenase
MKSHKPSLLAPVDRRHFLKTASLATGAVVFGVPALLRAANLNSKLNIAAIGVMGKGKSDTDHCAGENIVALCDVDAAYCAEQIAKYPNARFYQDFRRMFDELGKGIDAVTISTPDHFHAVAASRAMRLGKHVYCQKPLVQTVHEARYLRDLARKTGVVTQMGNQGSAQDGLRRAVECLQAGLIGQVREVHIWTDRPIWPQGMARPAGADEVPASLNWDIWLGPAPARPYKKGIYAPFNWRGWLDFGTGALGDMCCHTANMPYRGLQLGYPTEVEAVALGGMNSESYPIGSKIRFQFPARKAAQHSPVTFWWYDGGMPDANADHGHDFSNKPPGDLLSDIEALLGEIPNSACLILGDQGKMFSPDDYGEQFFVKLNDDQKFVHYQKHPAVEKIPQTIPRNTFKGDTDLKHHLEWIAAIKENKPDLCYSRFEIAAPFAETMLAGCVALRVGRKIKWDGPGMRATNAPEAVKYIKRDNRAGWALA